MYFITDALLATLQIFPNSLKTFGQVRGAEPLSFVLSLLHSQCAFTFIFLQLRKLTEISCRLTEINKSPSFSNIRIAFFPIKAHWVRNSEILPKTNSLCQAL